MRRKLSVIEYAIMILYIFIL